MWNPGAPGQMAYPPPTTDANAWGQQAALWTQQQQQQQQQMWNSNYGMWNHNMGPPNMGPPNMGPPNMGPPNMNHNMNHNMGPDMGQYGMDQSAWNVANVNWSVPPPGVPPPSMPTPSVQPYQKPFSNNNNYNQNQKNDFKPSTPTKPLIIKEKEKPLYKRSNIVLPEVPKELQPQVEVLKIHGVVPANRKASTYISATGMGFYCQVCECYISSLPNSEAHVTGTRHKQNKKFKDGGGDGVFVVATKKRYVHTDAAPSAGGEVDMANKELLGTPMPKKRRRKRNQEGAVFEDDGSEDGDADVNPEQAPPADEIYFDFVDSEAIIQSQLEAIEDSVIGLNEIVEHRIPDEVLPAYYICHPCDVRLNANNLLFHIKGLRHRITYMKTLKPDDLTDLETLRHYEQVALINKLSTALEAELGKGRVRVAMDHDASHHPYSIRMAIRAKEGHPVEAAAAFGAGTSAEGKEPSPPGTIVASETKAPAKVVSKATVKTDPTVLADGGKVLGTKIVVKPDGTKVRVRTILRAKVKTDENGEGGKTKTTVKRKGTSDLSCAIKMATAKQTSPSLFAGINDQPLVFGNYDPNVTRLSRLETGCQTEDVHFSYILQNLAKVKVGSEMDYNQAKAVMDLLNQAVTKYEQRPESPPLQDAVLDSDTTEVKETNTSPVDAVMNTATTESDAATTEADDTSTATAAISTVSVALDPTTMATEMCADKYGAVSQDISEANSESVVNDITTLEVQADSAPKEITTAAKTDVTSIDAITAEKDTSRLENITTAAAKTDVASTDNTSAEKDTSPWPSITTTAAKTDDTSAEKDTSPSPSITTVVAKTDDNSTDNANTVTDPVAATVSTAVDVPTKETKIDATSVDTAKEGSNEENDSANSSEASVSQSTADAKRETEQQSCLAESVSIDADTAKEGSNEENHSAKEDDSSEASDSLPTADANRETEQQSEASPGLVLDDTDEETDEQTDAEDD